MQYAQEGLTDFGIYSQNATSDNTATGTYLIQPTSGIAGAQKAPVACAPTSTVNSLVYLQNAYGITGLVDPTNAYNTINTLASGAYMSTNDQLPNPPANYVSGTTAPNMLAGKEKYLQNHFTPQKGYTAIQTVGQSLYSSQPANGAAIGGVTQTAPTTTFIQQQLAAGEDVEMGFLWSDSSGNPVGGGHVVTLTGIDYDMTTNSGSISFLDPFGAIGTGSAVDIVSRSLTFLSPLAPNGAVVFGYAGGAAGNSNDPDNPDVAAYGRIAFVYSESPVPEPAALTLLALGSGLFLIRRRRGPAGTGE
jgi:hypothetical protein